MTMLPERLLNHRAALDAALTLCLHGERQWRGASERGRYMITPHPVLAGALALVSFFICLALSSAWAQPQRAAMAAPTGTYEYYMGRVRTNSVPVFTLHLYTNGTYFAQQIEQAVPTQDGDLFRLLPRTNTARGTWHWDAEKREFQLEPGDFIFYIKTLPADKHNANRLVWGRDFLVRNENE